MVEFERRHKWSNELHEKMMQSYIQPHPATISLGVPHFKTQRIKVMALTFNAGSAFKAWTSLPG